MAKPHPIHDAEVFALEQELAQARQVERALREQVQALEAEVRGLRGDPRYRTTALTRKDKTND
jgi:hypothetical protein